MDRVRRMKIIARRSTAYSISIVLTMISLAVFFSGIQIYGPISDLLGGVSSILLLSVIWQLHNLIRPELNRTSIMLLFFAVMGTILLVFSSISVASGALNWKAGGAWGSLGNGLVGIWFIASMGRIGEELELTKPLRYLGYGAGLSLTIGILAVLPLFSLVSINSLVSNIAISSTGVVWLLTCLWTFLLSRSIRNE